MPLSIKTCVIFLLIKLSLVLRSSEASYIDFTAYNIGQGNCMTVDLYEERDNKHFYIVSDAGSNAYKDDMSCQHYFEEKYSSSIASKNKSPLTPKKQPRKSIITPTSPKLNKLRSDFKHHRTKEEEASISEELITKVRESLGAQSEESPVNVKTIFISHPDTDHYNWIPKIFDLKTMQEDSIENIILGGLPERYNANLQEWLKSNIIKGTRVYFPSIYCDQPITEITDDILKLSRQQKFADQMFSDPEKGWPQKEFSHLAYFKEALPWGDDIKTYLLTVNPTHSIRGKKVRRGSLMGDDNSDSLVVNFRIGDYSLIITGDATNLTTDRVLENYEDYLRFFDTKTILTADHHGSYTHGSNHERWIEAIQPSYVVCSSGTTQHHPSIEAYERFKKSDKLELLDPPHDIWVYETIKDSETGKKTRKPLNHLTSSAVFSTFNSGDIHIRIHKELPPPIRTAMLNFSSIQPCELKPLKEEKKKEVPEDEIIDLDLNAEELEKLNCPKEPEEKKEEPEILIPSPSITPANLSDPSSGPKRTAKSVIPTRTQRSREVNIKNPYARNFSGKQESSKEDKKRYRTIDDAKRPLKLRKQELQGDVSIGTKMHSELSKDPGKAKKKKTNKK